MKEFVIICSWMLLLPMAAAAPWVEAEGGLYVRVSLASEEVETLQGHRADAYAAYGLTENLTLTLKAEAVAYGDAEDFNAQGWRATARRRLYQKGTFLISAEAGLLQGAAIGGRNGCETLGAEVRGGSAWTGKWRKRETYVFGEVAARFHNGCNRERYEFGIGQQATKNVWNVTQVWIERGSENAKSDKVQSEIIIRDGSIDYSLGYRNENGGRFQEESIFIALAKRF